MPPTSTRNSTSSSSSSSSTRNWILFGVVAGVTVVLLETMLSPSRGFGQQQPCSGTQHAPRLQEAGSLGATRNPVDPAPQKEVGAPVQAASQPSPPKEPSPSPPRRQEPPAAAVDSERRPPSASSPDAAVTTGTAPDSATPPAKGSSQQLQPPTVISRADVKGNTLNASSTVDFIPVYRVPERDQEKITQLSKCFNASNMKKWYFYGPSHTRNIHQVICGTMTGLRGDVCSNKKAMQIDGEGGTTFDFGYKPYLQLAKSDSPIPTNVEGYDAIVFGRIAWDIHVNNTFPHDYYMSLRTFLTKFRQKEVMVTKPGAKILFHLPHEHKAPTTMPSKIQCQTPERVKLYRSVARCAVHYANKFAKKKESPNAPELTDKIDLFDVYEYSLEVPRSLLDHWGHHYKRPALEAMTAQLLERHVCPGTGIGGQVYTDDALAFDADPWKGADEECDKMHEIAEAGASIAPLYAPLDEAIQQQQRNQPPETYDRDRIHMYRNFTAVEPDGTLEINGFRIRPKPMSAVDRIFEKVFDRHSPSCQCQQDFAMDSCELIPPLLRNKKAAYSWLPSVDIATHTCTAKTNHLRKKTVDHLPTYLNFSAMNEGHFGELMVDMCSGRNFDRVFMCFFNLGARIEDMPDEDYLRMMREKGKMNNRTQFSCQCSGVFAPHLRDKVVEHADEYEAFCRKDVPGYKDNLRGYISRPKCITKKYSNCWNALQCTQNPACHPYAKAVQDYLRPKGY